MGQVAQGRRPRLLAAALVTLLFAVIGVVVAIGLRSKGPAPLPVGVDRLPRPTRFVSRTDFARAIADRHRMREADVPDQALWTALAERACGGYDLHGLLVEADKHRRLAAVVLAQSVEAHQQALACGRALTDRGGRHRGLYRLAFDDEGEAHEVELMADGRDELPVTVPHFKDTPAAGNLVAARCLVPWAGDREASCGEHARALGRLGEDDAWVVGDLDELRAFGRSYALDVERDEDAFDALEQLAGEMATLPHSVVGLAFGFTNRLTVALDVGVSMHGEPETRALVTAVREGAVAWGMQRASTESGPVRIVVLARDAEEAAAIASAWAGYLERLRREIATRRDAEAKSKDPPDDKGPNTPASTMEPAQDEPTQQALRVRVAVARRAIDGAKVVVAGLRVELEARRAPNEAETAILAADQQRRAARAAVAAEAVDALAEGRPPRDELLVELGGEPFLRAVEMQRAIVADEWPFEPEAWPEVRGFFVPGRGRYDTEYHDTAEVFVYSYPMRRSALRRVFAEVARGKGWQVRRGSTANLYELSRGEQQVRVLLGGRTAQERTERASDGAVSSSLVLFAQP